MSTSDNQQNAPASVPPAQQQGDERLPMGYYADDEISLRELVEVLWAQKWLILALTLLAAGASAVYAFTATPTYQTDVLLAPAQQEEGPGISGQAAGLARLAGVDIGGGGASNKQEVLALLQSRKFTVEFVRSQEGMTQQLFAERWDAEAQAWRKDDAGESLEPSEGDIFRAFSDLLSVSDNQESGLVTVSIEWREREAIAGWLDALVSRLNSVVRQRDIEEANRSINYLEDEIQATSVVEMQQALYSLVERELQTIVLAKTRPEYAFRILDPPMTPDPDQLAFPNRMLIIALGIVLGGMLGVLLAFARNAFRKG